jgi:hypothetical protein
MSLGAMLLIKDLEKKAKICTPYGKLGKKR